MVEVVEDGGEEAEERPLVELVAELLVRLNKHEDDDREDLVQVPDLALVRLGSGRVTVVLEQQHKQLGQRIERDERRHRVGRL